MIQRASNTLGDIPISGVLPTGTYDVEARYAGGAWTTVASGASGAFTATLANQPVGNGVLEVRRVGSTLKNTINDLAIGILFVTAGQSNASCSVTNAQVYTGTPAGRLYGNDDQWHALTDCTDSAVNQVDTVSKDTSTSAPGNGSPWPLVATGIANDTGVPVGIIPCALGGSRILQWLPGADHFDRSTLYGNCSYRTRAVGPVQGWLWWQGESDAIDGSSSATYNSRLDTLANAINTDHGVKLVAVRLQNSTGILDTFEDNIRLAVNTAIGDNPNVLAGPDLSDMNSDDSFHIQTDPHIATAAARWVTAIEAAYGW